MPYVSLQLEGADCWLDNLGVHGVGTEWKCQKGAIALLRMPSLESETAEGGVDRFERGYAWLQDTAAMEISKASTYRMRTQTRMFLGRRL